MLGETISQEGIDVLEEGRGPRNHAAFAPLGRKEALVHRDRSGGLSEVPAEPGMTFPIYEPNETGRRLEMEKTGNRPVVLGHFPAVGPAKVTACLLHAAVKGHKEGCRKMPHEQNRTPADAIDLPRIRIHRRAAWQE